MCVPEADRYQVPVLAWCSVRLPRIWPCETRRQLRTGKGNEYLTGLGFHVRSGLVEPEPEPSSQLVTLSETHVSARLTRHHARRRCRYRGTTATDSEHLTACALGNFEKEIPYPEYQVGTHEFAIQEENCTDLTGCIRVTCLVRGAQWLGPIERPLEIATSATR